MKIAPTCIVSLLFGSFLLYAAGAAAQAIDPQKSARAAAASDAQFIADGIIYNEGVIFLSQKALERATDTRVKDLAQLILNDHTAMLYSMEQLATAGTGASKPKDNNALNNHQQAAELNAGLSRVPKADFDSMWAANLLTLCEPKYNELVAAKETVTNPRLKMAVTEAIPLLRKHVSQLRSTQKYLVKLATQKRKEEALLKKQEALQKKQNQGR